ncbi:cobalt-precorrin-5B (C(1))-methyltransferase CbiD [Dethiosulfovibrio sp. F2B]|uniref:cobalt-precorrin-5B (C(1))-methyltransferase CbiD n=1 Tax=Dethiosulfovibrio faecalis TaxID=2720018 RepID=UPI001F02E87F|nr:cobalt-precorrin-5B (C(1))-methyltransferase CbiD [Dethiosulfovibrio faecalis]MCF4151945.1 cobalt-precorrin-5B (C(1))-methyltransferase CbiD [Dethiosulfovibrio faecalis]
MTARFESLGSVGGLRRGFTSGTSVQAAAKAAAYMAVTGETTDTVAVELPNGMEFEVPVEDATIGEGWASCCVIKRSGDDPDVTDGHRFCCTVRISDLPGVTIIGGKGVGKVTKEGLPIPPGEPAINPTPRKMILRDLSALTPDGKGLEVTVSIPDGEDLAKKTWNPRLGIEGGISVIGTTGIVEPKSTAAWEASIDVYVRVAAKEVEKGPLFLPLGYIGEKLLKERFDIPAEKIVKTGDKVGYTLERCIAEGIEKTLIVGHIGKLTKLAAGIFDTNYRSGDGRLETVAAWAGASGASQSVIREILDLKLAEAAVPIIIREGLEETFSHISRRSQERLTEFLKGEMEIATALTDLEGTILSTWPEDVMEGKSWKKFTS